MDDSGDDIRPGRDWLSLLIHLFPIQPSDRQRLAGLDSDDGYDLDAECGGGRHVCVD